VPVGVLGTPTRAELGALATWADEVNPAHWSVGPDWVETAHRHGLRCRLWTVNRPATMRRALALGADAVITDRPRVLRRLVEAGDRAPVRSA
jgi:glycerophosphoryl diester phosphodiesterase